MNEMLEEVEIIRKAKEMPPEVIEKLPPAKQYQYSRLKGVDIQIKRR